MMCISPVQQYYFYCDMATGSNGPHFWLPSGCRERLDVFFTVCQPIFDVQLACISESEGVLGSSAEIDPVVHRQLFPAASEAAGAAQLTNNATHCTSPLADVVAESARRRSPEQGVVQQSAAEKLPSEYCTLLRAHVVAAGIAQMRSTGAPGSKALYDQCCAWENSIIAPGGNTSQHCSVVSQELQRVCGWGVDAVLAEMTQLCEGRLCSAAVAEDGHDGNLSSASQSDADASACKQVGSTAARKRRRGNSGGGSDEKQDRSSGRRRHSAESDESGTDSSDSESREPVLQPTASTEELAKRCLAALVNSEQCRCPVVDFDPSKSTSFPLGHLVSKIRSTSGGLLTIASLAAIHVCVTNTSWIAALSAFLFPSNDTVHLVSSLYTDVFLPTVKASGGVYGEGSDAVIRALAPIAVFPQLATGVEAVPHDVLLTQVTFSLRSKARFLLARVFNMRCS